MSTGHKQKTNFEVGVSVLFYFLEIKKILRET